MLPSSSVSCQGGSKVVHTDYNNYIEARREREGETVKRRRVNIQKWSGHDVYSKLKSKKKFPKSCTISLDVDFEIFMNVVACLTSEDIFFKNMEF